MKKSLIALAAATAFAAPAFAATGNVDVYGVIDGSVSLVDVNGADSYWSVGGHGNEAARLGFKGSEDLGGGLKAIWQIETQFSVDTTSTKVDIDKKTADKEIGNRNTFVGVAGGFGTILIGRHDTPEKMSTGKMDMFADTMGDYNVAGAIIDTREANVLAYVSPSFSGLTIAAATVAGESAADNDGIADHYSIAAMYANGPLSLAAGYTSMSEGYVLSDTKLAGETFFDAPATLPDTKAFRLGAGYTMGDLTVGVVYQNIDVDGLNAAEDGYSVGAAYNMGPITLKAQYMAREDVSEGFAVGADYNMSKRTKAYMTWSTFEDDFNADMEVDILSIGVRHSF